MKLVEMPKPETCEDVAECVAQLQSQAGACRLRYVAWVAIDDEGMTHRWTAFDRGVTWPEMVGSVELLKHHVLCQSEKCEVEDD